MNAKHTPTPWTYNGTDSTILTRTGEFTLIRTNGIGDTRNNAKHLVKCVNMHDELVGALNMLTDIYEKEYQYKKQEYGDSPTAKDILNIAKQALSKARGE